jgi:undecaprenyl-diphosphatase
MGDRWAFGIFNGTSSEANPGMLNSLSTHLGQILLHYGGWGLFVMSFLDSSFIPFPVVNDVALMVMASKRPMWWPLYGLATTLGSMAGAYVLYGLARSGRRLCWRKMTPRAVARAQLWLERNQFVSVLVACILPPPAPLKVFLLTAGALRVNAFAFGLALLVGRGLRFAADAWLGAHYGVQAQVYMRHNIARVSLAVVAIILALAVLQWSWAKYVTGTRE